MNIHSRIQDFLDSELKNKDSVNVLEAGCGSLSKITFEKPVNIIGIDISEKQLERNKVLNKKIQGDLHTYDLGENNYDIIICWDVLEHLEKPAMALDNMTRSLTPGGSLILKLPNMMSLKGLVTKFTSHRFHVLYYKLVYKQKNAGQNDTGPFRNYLSYNISVNGLKKYARSRGFDTPFVQFFDISDAPHFLSRLKFGSFLKSIYVAVNSFFRFITFGWLNKSELMIVIKKPLRVEAKVPLEKTLEKIQSNENVTLSY